MTRFCPSCGTANSELDQFCHACAQPLTSETPPKPAVSTGPTPAAAQPRAKFCHNCGTRNGAQDRFCHACATPLSDPAATGQAPTPGSALGPVRGPVPVGAGVPAAVPAFELRRLPRATVVAVVVGGLLLVAGVGIALGVIGGGPDEDGPVGTAEPVDPGSLKLVDVANIAVQVPASWTVVKQDPDTIGVADPTARILWLRSGAVGDPFTLDSLQQRLLDKFVSEAPDAKICAGPETGAVPGGPAQGRYMVICYTFIPQGGGQAALLSDAYYLGLDVSGTTVFVMQLTASPTTLDEFAATTRVLPAPRWKLFGAGASPIEMVTRTR